MAYCKTLPGSEVIYSGGSWHCCGQDQNSNPRCNNPQGPSFSDPSPFDLTKIAVIQGSSTPTAYSLFPTGIAAVTSGVSVAAVGTAVPTDESTTWTASGMPSASLIQASTAIISASSTAAATVAASTASADSGTQISPAATAGIVVGTICLVGALVAALAWFFCAAKKRKRRTEHPSRTMSCDYLENGKGAAPPFRTYRPGLSRGVSKSATATTSYSEVDANSPLSARSMSTSTPATRHGAPVYEMQSPVGVFYHELDARAQPSEMMDSPKTEDRMAGGGPDKRLPSLPTTPSTPSGDARSTRRSSYLARYQYLLGRR